MQLSFHYRWCQCKVISPLLSPGRKSVFRFTNLLTLSSMFTGFHQVLSLFSLYSDLCSPPLEEQVPKTRPGPEGRIPLVAAISKVVILCGSTGRAELESQVFRQAHSKETQDWSFYCLITAVQRLTVQEACHLAAWPKATVTVIYMVFSWKFNMKEYKSWARTPSEANLCSPKTYELQWPPTTKGCQIVMWHMLVISILGAGTQVGRPV